MKNLGSTIKSLRKTQHLTLTGVARVTGIDEATLSRIENGKMTGTLDSHMRIAAALGIKLPDLYSQVLTSGAALASKHGNPKLEKFSHSKGVFTELLSNDIRKNKMVPILIKMNAQTKNITKKFSGATERFIYVLRGSVEIIVGDEKKIVGAGESLYFNANVPHYFHNQEPAECKFLSIITNT